MSDDELTGLEAERARRGAQVAAMRDAGREPYPYRFDRTATLGEVRARHGAHAAGTDTGERVSVAGRVMLTRDQGKLQFLTIRDRTGELQLFVSKATVGDAAFDEIACLDRGDWVGAHGTVMTTRKGELSINVASTELLAKAIRPLPDKWHGLVDVETRSRQRYADLIVNEEARRTFEVRHATVASFRRTLTERGYLEVETPVLHVEAGGAHARPFVTHHHTLDMQLYLRIALELHLKRLIVGGMERVYEIGRVFRNEGISTRHNPEFTMMESYQAFADHTDVMDLTEVLIRNAARDALGTTVVTIRGKQCDLASPWRRVRMIDIAGEAIGEKLHPSQPVEALRKIAAKHGVNTETRWGSGRIIEEIFAEKAEASLIEPTFVTGHPVEISPLARVDRNDPHLTERFELFVGTHELANGFSELNDPIEQRERFNQEAKAKAAGNLEAGTIDEDYLRALEYGLPPTGGLGIGIDRLVMLLSETASIKDVILFPTLRPEVFEP
ncbi:MAG: lysine--tRNA ligase [Actinomycetota bacterium]